MDQVLKRLEEEYQAILAANSRYQISGTPEEAYADGFLAAIEIFRKHTGFNTQQSRASGIDQNPASTPLYRMAPEKIVSLDLNMQVQENPFTYPSSVLIEAAFRFENQLMEALGDDNTIPYDAYENLDANHLVRIILASVEKILQLGSKS